MPEQPCIALTAGEPAGIGPDLTVMLAQKTRSFDLVAIADPLLLQQRAEQLGLPLHIHEHAQQHNQRSGAQSNQTARKPGHLSVQPVRLEQPCVTGQLNPTNAAYVLKTLDDATDGCLSGAFDAMVTAPLHKGVINDAGIAFTGHTEYLAQRTHSQPVMMLATDTAHGPLRVALATTHLPLSQVAQALTSEVLQSTLRILYHDLQQHFGIAEPHIVVAGLNPHAGESGHMGREEIEIIEPVLAQLRAQGWRLSGPLPADTLFTPYHLHDADAVLAMFHDQGLPVLKYAGFGQSINVTLGLPIIRTSVDHGTALDKAGTGDINQGSLQAALDLACAMAASKKH